MTCLAVGSVAYRLSGPRSLWIRGKCQPSLTALSRRDQIARTGSAEGWVPRCHRVVTTALPCNPHGAKTRGLYTEIPVTGQLNPQHLSSPAQRMTCLWGGAGLPHHHRAMRVLMRERESMAKRGGQVAPPILMIVGSLLYGILAFAWAGPAAAPRSNGPSQSQLAEEDERDEKPAKTNAAPHDPTVIFDALPELHRAKASVRAGRKERGCTWLPDPGRFRCGREGWATIGPHAGRSGGKALHCLWMHPQAKGATTLLTWKSVAMGARVHARISLLKGAGDGKPVTLKVRVDERLLVSASTKDEWLRGEADAAIFPGRSSATVRLEVEASNNRWRMACVELWMTGKRTRSTRARSRRLQRLPGLPSAATATRRLNLRGQRGR